MAKTGTMLRMPQGPIAIRLLVAGDLDAVAAIDKAASGRSRRGFYEKRLGRLAREPQAFIALAAERGGAFVGFLFARLYEGEFGTERAEAALDAIGVAADAERQGVGRSLVGALTEAMRGRGIAELSTEIDWSEAALGGFFARVGFSPAPRLILERAVSGLDAPPRPRLTPSEPAFAAEADYSGPSGDDFEALSHDRIPVRSLTAEDLPAILRIDRRHTARDRTAYFRTKLAEAIEESGVRVSLAAEAEGQLAGFIMARVELGEFGRFEPEAVIDTIGIDPDFGHKGIGSALFSQLMTNLRGLRVERVRTELAWNDFGLLSFLDRLGFQPGSRLALRRERGP